MIRYMLALLASFMLLNCGSTLVEAQREALAHRFDQRSTEIGYAPSERCQSLSDRHETWGAIAQSTAVLAGASGFSALPAEELPENVQGPFRYTAAGLSVSSAAVSAAAAWIAEDAAKSFTRECMP